MKPAADNNTEADELCHHRTRDIKGRHYICVIPKHRDGVGHYYQRDLKAEEEHVEQAKPSNAHLESQLEAVFRNEVRKAGGMAIKTMPTVKGFPDRLVVFPGAYTYLVELKAVGGRLSDAQKVQHHKLRERGIEVVVLEGRTQVVAWVKAHLDKVGPKFRGYKA